MPHDLVAVGEISLAGEIRPVSSAKQRESEAERMAVLVDDLLLLARLDSADSAAAHNGGRALASEPVDLSALVVNAVSDAHVAERYGPADHVLEPGEEHKTLASAEAVLRAMATAGIAHGDHVVALEGRVGTEGERRIAERVVTDMVGIETVENNLVVDELRRAQSTQGTSPIIEASIAYALNRKGELRPAARHALDQQTIAAIEQELREVLALLG